MKENKYKKEDFKSFIRKMEALLEMFVLTLVYMYLWKFFYREYLGHNYYGRGKWLIAVVYVALVFILFFLCDSFKYGHRRISEVIISQCTALLIVDLITYFQLCLIAARMLYVWPMLLLLLFDVLMALGFVFFYTKIYHNMYVPKNMVMVYGNEKALTLKLKMDRRPDKYHITKIISCKKEINKIIEGMSGHDAVILNDIPSQIRNDLLKYCYANNIRTYIAPKLSDIILRGGEEINLFDTPLYLVKGRGLSPVQKFAKRTFDLVLCMIALIPALPIMAVIAICIKCEDQGPVFYRQERLTEGGRVFEIIKFRSMIVDAEREGRPVLASDYDPRITKVGRVIRAIRFDEIPQILNILKGDMSWIGPRPEREEFVKSFVQEVPEFSFRMKVKGGLSGYAQIYGKYNTSSYDKLRLDLIYIENYSFFLDLKLILMTLQILFRKDSTEGIDKAEELEKERQKMLEKDSDEL